MELKDHFKAAGPVLHAKIFNRAETTLRSGVVEMGTEEAAKKALEILDGSVLREKRIFVRPDNETLVQSYKPLRRRRSLDSV